MTDAALAQLSDRLFVATVLLYALSMLAFAGEQAARRSRRVAEATAAGVSLREAAAARTRALAGAGGPTTFAPAPSPATGPATARGSRAGVLGVVLEIGRAHV